jgi:Tol biopolymer transport system component
MDKDGSNQQQLTNLEGDELLPDWSPDGSRIVFVAEGDGNAEIYAVDVTTKSTIRLTNNKVIDFSPSWSSNGKSVAFTSEDPKKRGLLQIFTMDADGSNVQQFTDDGDLNGHPVWCPDDTCIVYEHGWDNPKLMVIDLETKEIRPLLTGAYATNPDTHEWWPSKSHQRGYINFAINDTLYAFDINNKKLYSLGLQAIDAALYP